jgi:hypothetical protein
MTPSERAVRSKVDQSARKRNGNDANAVGKPLEGIEMNWKLSVRTDK